VETRDKKTRQIENLEPRFDSIETEKTLGSRLFRLRYLAGCRISLQPELVDLSFRIRDCGLGVEPCKADFERRKRNAIDDHGFQIRPPNPGVPQAFSSLESLDFKVVMVALHLLAPGGSRYFPCRRKHEPAATSVNSFTFRGLFLLESGSFAGPSAQ
jgi:hypothetical protein